MTASPTRDLEITNLSAAVAWQHETIVRQREQIAAQAAEIERLQQIISHNEAVAAGQDDAIDVEDAISILLEAGLIESVEDDASS